MVSAGLTEILAVVADVFHEYETAPEAVSVAELPAQTVELLTLTVGVAFTFTCAVFVFTQFPLVPVTVYTVVEAGLTTILDVEALVLHE